MRAFCQLLDDLVYTRSRNSKLRLIGDYLKTTPDPDRGLALAALTGTLDIPAIKPAVVRALAEERIDPVLLRMSRDYVGDMAETVSLLWPSAGGRAAELDDGTITLSEAVARLSAASRVRRARKVLAAMLDHLDAVGTLRVAQAGDRRASGRDFGAARQAGAGRCLRARCRGGRGGVARAEAALCRAVRLGRGPRRPADGERHSGVPPVHARPSARRNPGRLDDYAAEWKWDGIRIQLVHAGGDTRLYSRTGDDISGSFPDIAEAFATRAVLDGELLVRGDGQGADSHGGAAASFNALQQRLGRKNVSAKMQGRVSRLRPPLRHPVRRRGGSCAACRGASGASGWRRWSRRSTPTASTCRN